MPTHFQQPASINGGLTPATNVSVAVPVVTVATYTSGQVVGGLLTFNGLPVAGVIESAHIKVASVQTAELRLYLFSSTPAASTFLDQASPAIAVSDVTKVIGMIDFVTVVSDLGTHSFYELTGIGKAMNAPQNTIYGVLITKGSATFAATTDVLGVALVVVPA